MSNPKDCFCQICVKQKNRDGSLLRLPKKSPATEKANKKFRPPHDTLIYVENGFADKPDLFRFSDLYRQIVFSGANCHL